MDFEIVGPIEHIEIIATVKSIRDLARLRKIYGPGRWRKLKGIAQVQLRGGGIALVRGSWYWRNQEETIPRLMRTTMGGNSAPRFVVCIDNSGYEAALELHNIYAIVPDPEAAVDGDLRIVDESGEDYIYSTDRFVPIDAPLALEQAMLRKASWRNDRLRDEPAGVIFADGE